MDFTFERISIQKFAKKKSFAQVSENFAQSEAHLAIKRFQRQNGFLVH